MPRRQGRCFHATASRVLPDRHVGRARYVATGRPAPAAHGDPPRTAQITGSYPTDIPRTADLPGDRPRAAQITGNGRGSCAASGG